MSYLNYGISTELVESVKAKLKKPTLQKKIKELVKGITKKDLQDRAKVKSIIRAGAKTLDEPLADYEVNRIADFVIDQKIDPNNTFHLIKLWNMFR